jgi:hypothetical protein
MVVRCASQGQSSPPLASEPFEHELEGGQPNHSHHTPQGPLPEYIVMRRGLKPATSRECAILHLTTNVPPPKVTIPNEANSQATNVLSFLLNPI